MESRVQLLSLILKANLSFYMQNDPISILIA